MYRWFSEVINRDHGFLGYLVVRQHAVALTFIDIPSKNLIILRVQFNFVFLKVEEQFVGAKHFRDFHKLIVIVMTMEEGLLPEDLSIESICGDCETWVHQILTIDANMHPRLHMSRL